MGCVSSQPRRSISLPEESLVDLNNVPTNEPFSNHVQLLGSLSSPSRRRSNGHVRSNSTGTVGSRPGAMFSVNAMSNRGKTVCAKLEITESEILLHRNGHGTLKWPLNFLRRYGYEDGVFSFESGRRCKSGPGVFTFQCPRAEELFQLVQNNIQENAASLFPNNVPPVIWERVPSSAESAVTIRNPNRPVTHPKNGTYLRPNSAILYDESTGSTFLESDIQQGEFLLPTLDRPDQDSTELAVVNIRPRENKPKPPRPASLVLPATSGEQYSGLLPSSESGQMLVDNVFHSPSISEHLNSPQHAYVNVEPAVSTVTKMPFQTAGGKGRFPNTAGGLRTPETVSELRAPFEAVRAAAHTHSYSDVTSDRNPTSSYVTFADVVPPSPRAMIDYVTLSVGPSPAQSPMPTSFSFQRQFIHPRSPQRSVSTSASPVTQIHIGGGSLGRPRFRGAAVTSSQGLQENNAFVSPPSSVYGASNYAKIDYDKTRALKETSRGNTIAGHGSRSRHDSAFM